MTGAVKIRLYRLSVTLVMLVLVLAIPLFSSAQLIVTIAGTGIPAHTGDGGPAIVADIFHPKGIVVDAAGNIYFVEGGASIRKISPAGVITTIGGNGTIGFGADGIPATATQLFFADGIAIGGGNIYFAEMQGNRIRKIDAMGIVHTVAGTGTAGFSGDGGPATAAMLNYPMGVDVDVEGNVYFSDFYNSRIRKITTGGIVSTIAGMTWPTGTVYAGASGAMIGDGGPATNAIINSPRGIRLDGHGSLYISDSYGRIRKMKLSTGIITTAAGNGVTGYSGDGGPATAAQLSNTFGVGIDPAGNIYIADRNNGKIRKVDTFGIITTVAGNGYMAGPSAGGYSGDYCYAPDATLFNPWDVTSDINGYVYLSDGNNYRVRKLYAGTPPTFTTGSSYSLAVCHDSGPHSLDAILSVLEADANQTEVWSILSPPSHGTLYASDTLLYAGSVLTPSGMVYTPAAGYTGSDAFSVMVTDCGHESDIINVYVSVEDWPGLSTIAGPYEVCVGASVTLSNTVPGGTWTSVSPNASISSTGVVTGIAAGSAGIAYSVANSCGTEIVTTSINVIDCPNVTANLSLTGTSLKVLPNPNHGSFGIYVASPVSEKAHVRISDVAGRLLYETNTATNKKHEVNNNLPEGVYFISVTTESGVKKNEKVIVVR